MISHKICKLDTSIHGKTYHADCKRILRRRIKCLPKALGSKVEFRFLEKLSNWSVLGHAFIGNSDVIKETSLSRKCPFDEVCLSAAIHR